MKIEPVTIACGACCGPTCFTLECETRGGIAELCGFPEYPGHVSTPPMFYKNKLLEGSTIVCDCYYGTCLEGTAVAAATFTGTKNGELCAGFGQVSLGGYSYNPGTGQISFITTFVSGYSGKLADGCPTTTEGYTNGTLTYFNFDPAGSATVTGSIGAFGGGGCPGSNSGATALTAQIGNDYGVATASKCVCIDKQSVSTKVTYSGQIIYDPNVSCSEPVTNTGSKAQVKYLGTECGDGVIQSATTSPASSVFEDYYLDTYLDAVVVTATSKSQSTTNTCDGTHSTVAFLAPGATAFRRERLVNADTEEDAIVRLWAKPEAAWSGFRVVDDGNGVTCLNPACCRATYEERTGKTFEIQEARYRGTVKDLTGFQPVEVKIHIYRKKRSAAVYELYLTRTYMLIADLSGQAQVTDDVPNAIGYDTYAGRCSYKLV